MSSEDQATQELLDLEEEALKVADQVQTYQRKLMAPVYAKRREIAKQIPNFWSQVLGNSPLFGVVPSENDIEALENLTDFHVEYDDKKPDYRKVVATFKKNNVFKNETLTKEFVVDPETDGTVISKTAIDYHENKAPKKRNQDKSEEDDEAVSFLEWFGDDDLRFGIFLSEDIFPNALDYFQGDDYSDIEGEDIELDSEEDFEDEEPKKKKSKK
jgi:hypothetical protein